MMKIISLLSIAIILCISRPLLYSTAVVYAEENDTITSIYIVTPSWQNQTHEDGTGLFFDTMRAVYEPLGIEVTYQIVPWKRASNMVENKEADAMFCVLQDSEHLIPKYPHFVDYTAVIFARERIQKWEGLHTLHGKSAAWPRGYDYHKQPQFQGITLQFHEVNYPYQGFAMLASGRVDFYIDALIDVELYIQQQHIDMAPYQLEIPYGKNTYVGFSKTEKSEKLIEIYDARIPELLQSGELEKLFKKWQVRFDPLLPDTR